MRRTRIAVAPDGRLVVTDNWASTGIKDHLSSINQAGSAPSKIPSGEEPRLVVSGNTYSTALPIGIIDHGLLHGEEPIVSGLNGTGAIYIHGCPLRCATCYQPEFFADTAATYTSVHGLAELMLSYERAGAHTISIVIGTYRTDVHWAIKSARHQGLSIPVVYNYSGMLAPVTLAALRPDVDIFLPDIKAVSPELSALHNLPAGYPAIAIKGIKYLLEEGQTVIIRHLLVPHYNNHAEEIKTLISALDLGNTEATLSFLTHFFNPKTKSMTSLPPKQIADLKRFAEGLGVRTYSQGVVI